MSNVGGTQERIRHARVPLRLNGMQKIRIRAPQSKAPAGLHRQGLGTEKMTDGKGAWWSIKGLHFGVCGQRFRLLLVPGWRPNGRNGAACPAV